MYPPQTSLIPVTVALTRFFEAHGISSFFSNYPYWYLGTTPYKYLTGPILPLIISYLDKLIPNVSLFTITIYLIGSSFLLAAIGWGILVGLITKINIKEKKNIFLYFFYVFLFLLFPWKYLAGFALGEGSATVATNMLPFAFIFYWRYLQRKSVSNTILSIVITSVILLISTNILPVLLIGIVCISLAYSFDDGKFRKIFRNLKPVILILLGSILIVTLYYSPSYWLTILTNPSIGGHTTVRVILRIFDLLKGLVPLGLAIVAVYFSGKIKSRFMVFALTWLFAFLFLTLFRFISDPDFWTDWSGWFTEVEIGLFLLSSRLILSGTHHLFTLIRGSKYPKYLYYRFYIYLIFFGFVLAFLVLDNNLYNRLGRPILISGKPSAALMTPLESLNSVLRGKTAFLSGSSVFWADAFYDIRQVRGGKDEVAVNPDWDKASWEIREGQDPEKTKVWLEKINVSYVLVHTSSSGEYYHDFKHLEKWSFVGKNIWEHGGDVIYHFEANTH